MCHTLLPVTAGLPYSPFLYATTAALPVVLCRRRSLHTVATSAFGWLTVLLVYLPPPHMRADRLYTVLVLFPFAASLRFLPRSPAATFAAIPSYVLFDRLLRSLCVLPSLTTYSAPTLLLACHVPYHFIGRVVNGSGQHAVAKDARLTTLLIRRLHYPICPSTRDRPRPARLFLPPILL